MVFRHKDKKISGKEFLKIRPKAGGRGKVDIKSHI